MKGFNVEHNNSDTQRKILYIFKKTGMWFTADCLNTNIIMSSSAHKHLIHLVLLAVQIYFQYVAQTPTSHLVTSMFQNSKKRQKSSVKCSCLISEQWKYGLHSISAVTGSQCTKLLGKELAGLQRDIYQTIKGEQKIFTARNIQN